VQPVYGYFHGRFQPFHNGHLALVQCALGVVPELVIGISNPFRAKPAPEEYFARDDGAMDGLNDARNPWNNPWPMWARVLMIREGLRSAGVDLGRILMLPNLLNTGLPASEAALPKEMVAVFICPKSEHNRVTLNQYRRDGWRVEVFPVCESAVGASEIRRRMRQNEEWESLVPAGTAEVIRWLQSRRLANV